MRWLLAKLGWFRPVVRVTIKDRVSGAYLWSGSPLYIDVGLRYVFVHDASKGADAAALYEHVFIRHLVTLEKHRQ